MWFKGNKGQDITIDHYNRHIIFVADLPITSAKVKLFFVYKRSVSY